MMGPLVSINSSHFTRYQNEKSKLKITLDKWRNIIMETGKYHKHRDNLHCLTYMYINIDATSTTANFLLIFNQFSLRYKTLTTI